MKQLNFRLPEVASIHTAVISDGDVFLSDTFSHQVLRLDMQTGATKKWPNPDIKTAYPTGLAIDGNRLLVCDSWNHRLLALDMSGNLVASIGEYGSGESSFDSPESVSLSPDGHIWVADMGNDRIKIYTADLQLKRIISGSVLLGSSSISLWPRMAGLNTGGRFHPRFLAFCDDFWAVVGNHWLCVFEGDTLIHSWHGLQWAEYRLIGLKNHQPILFRQDGGLFLLDPDCPQPVSIETIPEARACVSANDEILVFTDEGLKKTALSETGSAPAFCVLTHNNLALEKPDNANAALFFAAMTEAAASLFADTKPLFVELESMTADQIRCGLDILPNKYDHNQLPFGYIFWGEARQIHYRFSHFLFRHLAICIKAARELELLRETEPDMSHHATQWAQRLLELTGALLEMRNAYAQTLRDQETLQNRICANWHLFHYEIMIAHLNQTLCWFAPRFRPNLENAGSHADLFPTCDPEFEEMVYHHVSGGQYATDDWQRSAKTGIELATLEAEKYRTGISTEPYFIKSVGFRIKNIPQRHSSHCYVEENCKYLTFLCYLVGMDKELAQLIKLCQADKVNLLTHAATMIRTLGQMGNPDACAPYMGILEGDVKIPDRGYVMRPDMIQEVIIAMADLHSGQGQLEKSLELAALLPDDLKPYFESMFFFRACDPRALASSSRDSRFGPNHAIGALTQIAHGRPNEALSIVDVWERNGAGVWSTYVRGLALRFSGQIDQAAEVFDRFGRHLLSGNLQKGIMYRATGDCETALDCFRKEAGRLPHWVVGLHLALTYKKAGIEEAFQESLNALPDYAFLIWDGQPVRRKSNRFLTTLDAYLALEQQDLADLTDCQTLNLPFASYLNFLIFEACRPFYHKPLPYRDPCQIGHFKIWEEFLQRVR